MEREELEVQHAFEDDALLRLCLCEIIEDLDVVVAVVLYTQELALLLLNKEADGVDMLSLMVMMWMTMRKCGGGKKRARVSFSKFRVLYTP